MTNYWNPPFPWDEFSNFVPDTVKSFLFHHSHLLLFFYLLLKMPLAVDESPVFSSCKLFTVQPWLQAQGVSAFYFHVPNVKHLLHLPMAQRALQSKQKAECWTFEEGQVLQRLVFVFFGTTTSWFLCACISHSLVYPGWPNLCLLNNSFLFSFHLKCHNDVWLSLITHQ